MAVKFVKTNLKGRDCLSELQERLTHLINYSSQLIFVSGDSIAQQQRALEDFLSIQKENTEVSYFTSELTMESPDFRRIICRQLLGQKVGSFVRPLNELLKDLHEQPGPYLLCIKQAQTLPNAFLQELWNWVTESKKQSPEHHVNVILFGETAWAEKAKKWLPKRNSTRPVLLSSQNVDANKFDVNALESLMAEERPKFSLELFTKDEFAPPIVTQKWFIAGVLVLLLSVFVGLMSWQYPDHVKSLIQTGSLPPESELNADELAVVNEQLERELERELQQAPTQKQDPQSAVIASENEDKSQIITSWEDAKQSSEQKIDNMRESIDEDDTQPSQDIIEQSQDFVEQSAEISANNTDSSIAPLSSSPLEVVEQDPALIEGDFAVPDIISVEQLDASLGNQLLTQEALAAEEVLETDAPNDIYEFDEQILLALQQPGVLLQLSGIQNRSVLVEYIVDNQLQDLVWVYQTTRYGGAWHVVLFNQRFDSVNAAREAITLLPASIQATSPFAKDLAQIKLEIRNR